MIQYGVPGAIGNGRVFPASEEAVLKLAKKIVGKPVTIHGFRSSFRDWCAENGVIRDLAEASLAHDIGSNVQKAYIPQFSAAIDAGQQTIVVNAKEYPA